VPKTTSKDRKLQLVAIVMAIGAVAAGMYFASIGHGLDGRDSLITVALLGSLAAIACNVDIEASSNFSLSGEVMIFMAAIVVFRASGSLVGPALVGVFAALDWTHVRSRAWEKIAVNASADALGLLLASLVVWLIVGQANVDPALLFGVIVVAATVHLVVVFVLISVPISIATDDGYRSVLAHVSSFTVGDYPFAVLGLGLGEVYLQFGAAVLPLIVVPILIARGTFASYLKLQAGQEQTVETLILALEAKDQYTAGHAHRVATFSHYVGSKLALSPRRMERLRYAALMHDIGKLIVPNQILNKPGKLTEAEFERVKRHEVVSVELLRRIDFLAPVAGDTTTEAATAAVEGGGLVEPAIIHVADAFDAMTSTRSYRRALSQETAFAELRKGAGTQFNPDCVEALISAIESRNEYYGAGHEVDVHEWAVAPPEVGTGSAGLGDLVREEQVSRQ
jgi:hypothetical protein